MVMVWHVRIFYCILLLFVLSCGKNNPTDQATDATNKGAVMSAPAAEQTGSSSMSREAAPAMQMDKEVEGESSDVRSQDPTAETNKKIIYTAVLRILVDDLEASTKAVQQLTNGYKGYITSESKGQGYNTLEMNLQIRIPSADFNPMLAKLEQMAEYVEQRQVNSQDVTEEYVDIQTRLTSKRKALDQYYNILKRANTVSEVLSVQTEIRKLEEEMESIQGRMRYINQQADFSTINLTLYIPQDPERSPADSLFRQIWKSLKDGVDAVRVVFLWLLQLWPFLLIAALGVYLYRRRKRAKS
jgi:predicted esterase YcpF (UPF0227 family)